MTGHLTDEDQPSWLTFLSPSLGRALSDCVRLFMGPAEGDGSLAVPGENLHPHTKERETGSPAGFGNPGRFHNLGDFQESTAETFLFWGRTFFTYFSATWQAEVRRNTSPLVADATRLNSLRFNVTSSFEKRPVAPTFCFLAEDNSILQASQPFQKKK